MKHTIYTIKTMAIMLALVLFSSCGDADKEHEAGTVQSEQRLRITDDLLPRPSAHLLEARAKAKHDSLIQSVNIGSAQIKRDVETAKIYLTEEDQKGMMPLWAIHRYFENGMLLVSAEVSFYKVKEKLKKYLGFTADSSTWEGAMQKFITKMDPAVTDDQKRLMAKSLSVNAGLFEDLSQLNDDDMSRIIQLLDIIAHKQETVDDHWVERPAAHKVLHEEYVILSKVWDMPALKQNKDGYYLDNIHHVTDKWTLAWGTRYLNSYQYAIGIFHRRCRDVNATTPAARRAVAKKIAALMKEGAEMLN